MAETTNMSDILREIADNYQEFFNFLNQEHNLILTISEMDEIVFEAQKLVKKLNIPDVMPRFDSPKNWTEDYKHENGNYTCKCCRCKEYFFGHKRRVLCVECANKLVDDAL